MASDGREGGATTLSVRARGSHLQPRSARLPTCVTIAASRTSESPVRPALRLPRQPWQHVDVLGVHRLSAVAAPRVDVADLAAGVVAVENRRGRLCRPPPVPPT